MKKVVLFIFLLIISLSFYGCKETYQYVYMHDQDQIESIDIIIAEEGMDAPKITIVTSLEAAHYDQFIDELNQIEFQKYLYDEHPTIYNKQAVMITYENGDYEIITYDAQTVFFHTDQSSESRRFYVDKTTFDQLLFSYVL